MNYCVEDKIKRGRNQQTHIQC